MVYSLAIREEAFEDVSNGYLWYEERQKGLGNRFVSEVYDFLDYIEKNPLHYQIKRNSYREGVLKVFPFVIIYEVVKNTIIVYAVFPTRENPFKKNK